MKKKIAILACSILMISYLSCSIDESMDKNRKSGTEILEGRSQNSELRQSIINVFSSTSVLDTVQYYCITNGNKESISVQKLTNFGVISADMDVIINAGIQEFYMPFIKKNFNAKTNIIVINWDGIMDSLQIFDLNGNTITKNQIENNFSITFKTTVHPYDAQLSNGQGWRPWRRCYCKTTPHPEGGTSSVNYCTEIDINKADAGICGRTGFFRQVCSGDACQ